VRAFVIATLFFALQATGARAADQAIDVSAGTQGISGGFVQPVGPGTDVRLAFSNFEFTRTQNFSNLVIDVVANLAVHETFQVRSFGVYTDRVIRGPFHVTGGLIYNLNRIGGTSVPTDSSVVIAGVAYSQQNAGEIFTIVRWPAIAPYLGIGLSPRLTAHRRVAFFGDAGVFYQGNARVEFSASGAIAANYAQFQPYFDEGRRQLAAELGPVVVYPVIQIGVRFGL
jgi:hypothetical protein